MNLQQQATAALSRMRYCQIRKLKHSEHHHEAVLVTARLMARENQRAGAHYAKSTLAALGAVKAKQLRLV